MKGLEELDVVLVSQDEVSDIPGLDLRECLWTVVGLCAGVRGGSSLGPVEVPVPVGVGSLTGVALVLGGRLPPQPVIRLGLVISVRIVGGQEVPVQFVKKIRMIRVVLHQLVQHPGSHSWGDPFSGVDSTVNPHGGLISTASFANLSINESLDDY